MALFVTTSEQFIGLYLDYRDNSFHERLESIQYDATLKIKEAIRVIAHTQRNFGETDYSPLELKRIANKIRKIIVNKLG